MESNRNRTRTKAHKTTTTTKKQAARLRTTKSALQTILLATSLLASALTTLAADDFFPADTRPVRFASDSSSSTADSTSPPTGSNTSPRSNSSGSPFIWQPLPLRATFRPLNRQSQPPTRVPSRTPSTSNEALGLISERSISDLSTGDNLFSTASRTSGPLPSLPTSASLADDFFAAAATRGSSVAGVSPESTSAAASNFFQPPPPPVSGPTTTTTPTPTTPSSSSINFASAGSESTTPRPPIEIDEDLPTRQPMNRFRPTPAPSDDSNTTQKPATSGAQFPTANSTGSSLDKSPGRMSSDCFECICEASTNCNANSRCQTSDVRHTRCGMFLISYDQWLATGLSRELVTREALARDAAADERAFYECVTSRDCSERLLSIYMSRNRKDCDRDGRIDCYDYAAIHHSGLEQCASESLLDSQYWNDFNACLGFGR